MQFKFVNPHNVRWLVPAWSVNPLCAARWETDQDFVNRVVCGHSGRLTVDQVRQIRAFAKTGATPATIAASTGLTTARIGRLVRGATYGRIA